MPKLVLKVEGEPPREESFSGPEIVIGRAPECDLSINLPVLSRRHCRIRVDAGTAKIEDLGSTNGTWVNGRPVRGKTPIAPGDVISIGDVEVIFCGEAGPRPREEGAAPVADVLQAYSLPPSEARSLVPQKVDPFRAPRMFYTLYQISKRLGASASLEDLLRTSMVSIFQAIPADRGVVFVREPDGKLMGRIAFTRTGGFAPPETVQASSTMLGRAVNERAAILATDTAEDPALAGQASIVRGKIRSVLCAPLWEDEDVLGAIYLDSLSQGRAFHADDRALLVGITNLIGIRMKQEQLRSRLEGEARKREHLSRYHSPDVVEVLLRRGGRMPPERREVTVLFADIRNSTGLAERLGEQEIHRLVQRFTEIGSEAVFRFQGHVNKFVGDAILAVFNAPLDLEDHAGRAVEAAREIIRASMEIGRERPGWAFDVRVGINTGPVIAGDLGPANRVEYTVIGDAVNVAERLCKEAEHPIAVSGETWERLGGRYRGTDRGEIQVRGRKRPIRLFYIDVDQDR